MKKIKFFIGFLLIIAIGVGIYYFSQKYFQENAILKKMISRLEADSRVAEVLVTDVHFDERLKLTYTTIKLLEYDTRGIPLPAKYFTFSGNIIQFQSLVIRFDDLYVRQADQLRGKSVYLFWKVFLLDGKNTQEYEITKFNEVPDGYRVEDHPSTFERKLWKEFWSYALDPAKAKKMGIKNAQIEAPGSMFKPGHLYTIKIEHDGGLRIDATALPTILKGEKIL